MSIRSQQPTTREGSAGFGQRLRQRLLEAERSTVVSIAVVVYFFAIGVTWAMITPIGAIPDEPAHITYAAGVVRGDLGAADVVNHPNYPQLAVVTVPAWVGSITDPPRSVEHFSYPCYVTVLDRTGACAPTISNSTQLTRIPTTVTRYPPPYYWIVGLPTLVLAGEPAAYAMRIVSAALSASMIAMGLALASPSRRTWLALGATIALTPMVAQYAGSVNPSSLEISAALGLGIGLMGIAGAERRSHRLIAPLIATLSFALAWSRPRTYLLLIAVIAAAALLNTSELRRWLRDRSVRRIVLVGTAAAGVSALLFQRLFTSLTPVLTGPAAAVRNPSGAVLGLARNLHALERRSTDWGMHLIGRLGWLDHSPPRTVWIIWGGAALALVLLAMAYGRRRDRAALLIVSIGALGIAPLFILTSVISATEYQARYHLSLAVLIIIGATVVLSRLPENRGRRTASSILRSGVILAPVLVLISVAASLHRHSIGGEARLTDVFMLPFRSHEWLPPAGALVVAAIGAGLALTSAVVVFRSTSAQHLNTRLLSEK